MPMPEILVPEILVTEVRMAHAKEKPLFSAPADYEDDFYAWTYEQAELLRLGRFDEADLPNIIEELETLGRSERSALVSSYRLILSHLLKWRYQPSYQSNSWRNTLRRERRQVAKKEEASPALSAQADRLLIEAYDDARLEAADETDLPLGTFPLACPWTLDQIRDPDFLPE
ncbi:MAG: DUF29 domain-containing protein [Ancalomicrobiaceae bacterium]|nr:DUF29 domain-containing protein [Ancalomicrobiaceae bacterium]